MHFSFFVFPKITVINDCSFLKLWRVQIFLLNSYNRNQIDWLKLQNQEEKFAILKQYCKIVWKSYGAILQPVAISRIKHKIEIRNNHISRRIIWFGNKKELLFRANHNWFVTIEIRIFSDIKNRLEINKKYFSFEIFFVKNWTSSYLTPVTKDLQVSC